MYHFTSKTGLT